MRVGASWSDTCILNMSSRGLMAQAAVALERGSYTEIRRGRHVIVARVVWSNGHRIGLRAQDCLPIDSIVADEAAPERPGAKVERRATGRTTHEEHRYQAHAFEFAGMAVGGLLAAAFLVAALRDVLRPLGQVAAVLGGAG